ncbi:hypothetical protein CASFOL_008777 [Castilleja foliolosa]|uniref:DUF4378 domain-containing protein n=1 Tax=Castilleja foliolosa TaxID=1961234 RepID=A0ABD3E408_9LAMI
MTTGLVKEHNLEKQMGCIAGFLQIFDRHHNLSGKRHYSAKLLPPLSPVTDTTSEPEKSAPPSRAIFEIPKPSPADELRSPPPPKSPLLPVLEFNQGTRSPWKFGKETPRLSLDSRATTDAKGGLHPKQIRAAASNLSSAADDSQQNRSPSPSVIARLMGLEPLLPDSSASEPETKPQLRRSASESRVSRDLFQSRFTDNKPAHDNGVKDAQYTDPNNNNYIIKNYQKAPKGFNSPSPWKAPPNHLRKSFFDSGDFFPEPKLTASMYGEVENRLRIRGIEDPSKDLETLKQILEALQLKGLLHSRKQPEQNQVRHRNFVYEESPIVVMKPSRISTPTPINRRNQIRSPPVSPRRERNVGSPNRSGRSPSPTASTRSEGTGRRSNTLVKPKPLSIETQRRKNESTETRRASPVHSPKINPRKARPDSTASNRSPRSRKSTADTHHKEKITTVAVAEDESSSISGSSITTSTDTERSKTEDYKEGRHLLERCGKLLHSIAEISATDMQPSPVSVLDSAFYKDESSTPSPITSRRIIDFKDQSGEIEDCEIWSPTISPVGSKKSDDSDFAYISDILRASHYLPDESDVFLLLEKQQYLNGNDTSKVAKLKRKLIFDTINEILDRNNRLPPWKVVSLNNVDVTNPSLNKVWSEFKRIRKNDVVAEDLFEMVCGVLKKDLAGDGVNGWGDCPVEMSEAILDIERLIFKDLIGEIIRDLAALATRSKLSSMLMPRRKLVF